MRSTAPIVSFTFDDVPDTAFTNGARILGSYGILGTFYIAAGTCGRRDVHWRVIAPEQVRALHESGHEIGCHTYSHPDVAELTEQELADECRRNEDKVRELVGDIELTNFCYPYGSTSLPRKLQLQKRFDSCRGIYEGINAGTIDLGLLKVIELYDRTLSPEKLWRVLAQTQKQNGWLIFYVHDVDDDPSLMGCSPKLLHTVIDTLKEQNTACLSVAQAMTAIGYTTDHAAPLKMSA
jgi:peptidoglycan/xylan/chitin deacetylase (PgdA/CDA1 family)